MSDLIASKPAKQPVTKTRDNSRIGAGKPGPGRPKGVRNRMSEARTDEILETFERLGGIEHMVSWAAKNPTEFYRLYGKLLPKEVKAEHSGGLDVVHKWLMGNGREITF